MYGTSLHGLWQGVIGGPCMIPYFSDLAVATINIRLADMAPPTATKSEITAVTGQYRDTFCLNGYVLLRQSFQCMSYGTKYRTYTMYSPGISQILVAKLKLQLDIK